MQIALLRATVTAADSCRDTNQISGSLRAAPSSRCGCSCICEAVGVTLDLAALAERIRVRAADWQALSLSWTERGISPNYGKAMTSASFECEQWIGEILVWETGETELQTIRISEDLRVNKHYELEDAAQLDVVLSELIGLIRDGVVPPGAVTYSPP